MSDRTRNMPGGPLGFLNGFEYLVNPRRETELGPPSGGLRYIIYHSLDNDSITP